MVPIHVKPRRKRPQWQSISLRVMITNPNKAASFKMHTHKKKYKKTINSQGSCGGRKPTVSTQGRGARRREREAQLRHAGAGRQARGAGAER